jgi:hypothetical protein
MRVDFSFLTRKKRFETAEALESSELKRVFNAVTLTTLGIYSQKMN